MALTNKLTAIADAIRSKTGTTDSLTLDQMPTAIDGIQAGGGDADAVSSKVYISKVAADGNYVDVVHNLGTTDILLAVLWDETDSWVNGKYTMMSMYFKNNYYSTSGKIGDNIVGVYDGITTSVKFSTNSSYPIDENTFRFMPDDTSTTSNFEGDAGDYTVVIIAA